MRPDFAIELLFGEHSFVTAAKKNIDYLRVPPADYRYLGGSALVRMFFTRRVSLGAQATVAKLLSLGPMSRSGVEDGSATSARDRNGFLSYGEGSGLMWRFDAQGQVEVYKGLSLSARFFFSQYKLGFIGDGNVIDRGGQPVQSATDEYLGLLFCVGYVFQPKIAAP